MKLLAANPMLLRRSPFNIGLSMMAKSVALGIMLQGCSYFSPTESRPETVAVPDKWSSTVRGAAETGVQPWIDEFSDPELKSLVGEALQNNPGIRRLKAGFEVADEQTWLAWSQLWPTLTGGFKSSRTQRNNSGGFAVSPKPVNNFGVSLDFLWEIDLWYRLGNELEATEHDKSAAASDLYAAQLSLSANIAKSWFDTIVATQQLKLADKTIDSFRHTLEIVEQGYDRGVYKPLDVRLARSSLLGAEGRKESYLKIRDEATRTLEFFLGRYPAGNMTTPQQLPVIGQGVPVSVPSELLERRPDIIAAAERFFASDQRLIKARKNMLPTIQLNGSVGTGSKKLSDIFNPENLIWNMAGSLTQPLFNGGQLFAEHDQAEARVKQAAASYAEVVLQAFREVETTLAAGQWLQQQYVLLIAEVAESREAERLAEADYLRGVTDIVTLLESQRRALDAESSLLELNKQRMQNRVNLYLALGGPVIEPNKL